MFIQYDICMKAKNASNGMTSKGGKFFRFWWIFCHAGIKQSRNSLLFFSLRLCALALKRPRPTTEFRLTGSARFRCGRNLILNLTDSTENRDSPKIGKNLPLSKLIWRVYPRRKCLSPKIYWHLFSINTDHTSALILTALHLASSPRGPFIVPNA